MAGTTITWPLSTPSSTPVVGGGGQGSVVSGGSTPPPLRRQDRAPRRGLRLPVGVDKTGRAATVTGDEQDRKIIFTALGSNENNNAYQQDRGLGEQMVFDTNDDVLRQLILRRLKQVFADFELQRRYKLLDETISWEEDSDKQELILNFKYFNLEADAPFSFQRRFSARS